VIFLFLSCPIYSQEKKVDFKALRKEKPSGLKFKYDQFEGIAWISTGRKPYTISSILGTSTTLYLEWYFGIKNNGEVTPKRMRVRYIGSDWMFGDGMAFICGTPKQIRMNEVTPFSIDLTDRKGEVHSTVVWEEFDNVCGDGCQKLLSYYYEGGKYTRVRYSGDKYLEFSTLGGKMPAAIKLFEDYYNKKVAESKAK
jgi:hypothetical protein